MPPEPAPSTPVPDVNPLVRLTPAVGAAYAELYARVGRSARPERTELVDRRIGQLLRDDRPPHGLVTSSVPADKLDQLPRWSSSRLFSDEERACLGFTEQFVIDVAAVDDQQRAELSSVLGPSGGLDFVAALFALDYGRRVTLALGRLFPDGPVLEPAGETDGAASEVGPSDGTAVLGAFDQLSRAVALLDALDPVTTELVRLRGARQHNCRLCQSTRSVRALDAGADEVLFDTTERYEASDLPEAQKVALRLTDAMITQPTSIDRVLADQVHRWYTPRQVVELVMDVMRNSGQKIAVALAADDPHVASGVERFVIGAGGSVEYLA